MFMASYDLVSESNCHTLSMNSVISKQKRKAKSLNFVPSI